MIPSQVQYEFVYQALLEAHRIGETQIPAHEMGARYSELKSVGKETGKWKLEEQFVVTFTDCVHRENVWQENVRIIVLKGGCLITEYLLWSILWTPFINTV